MIHLLKIVNINNKYKYIKNNFYFDLKFLQTLVTPIKILKKYNKN